MGSFLGLYGGGWCTPIWVCVYRDKQRYGQNFSTLCPSVVNYIILRIDKGSLGAAALLGT